MRHYQSTNTVWFIYQNMQVLQWRTLHGHGFDQGCRRSCLPPPHQVGNQVKPHLLLWPALARSCYARRKRAAILATRRWSSMGREMWIDVSGSLERATRERKPWQEGGLICLLCQALLLPGNWFAFDVFAHDETLSVSKVHTHNTKHSDFSGTYFCWKIIFYVISC